MEPVRTCIGCRTRAETSTLLRVVLSRSSAQGGEVVPDPSATLPGRGAWVHPTAQCIELSVKRRAFGRALRVNVPLGTDAIYELVGFQLGSPNEQAD
ncbi:MAG: YlxR family protein [Rhodoglobus sp.]